MASGHPKLRSGLDPRSANPEDSRRSTPNEFALPIRNMQLPDPRCAWNFRRSNTFCRNIPAVHDRGEAIRQQAASKPKSATMKPPQKQNQRISFPQINLQHHNTSCRSEF